ncbi:unnamed protein product [Protopolystoma xenopodis]|uniref:Uncharacterized protein n=1 Tax=Protopolystoma xenopodis TaxID=117903 RepID=A0A448XRK2_9PLAT|nr:unnamed protein product [Protopolystoma xenopodis]
MRHAVWCSTRPGNLSLDEAYRSVTDVHAKPASFALTSASCIDDDNLDFSTSGSTHFRPRNSSSRGSASHDSHHSFSAEEVADRLQSNEHTQLADTPVHMASLSHWPRARVTVSGESQPSTGRSAVVTVSVSKVMAASYVGTNQVNSFALSNTVSFLMFDANAQQVDLIGNLSKVAMAF